MVSTGRFCTAKLHMLAWQYNYRVVLPHLPQYTMLPLLLALVNTIALCDKYLCLAAQYSKIAVAVMIVQLWGVLSYLSQHKLIAYNYGSNTIYSHCVIPGYANRILLWMSNALKIKFAVILIFELVFKTISSFCSISRLSKLSGFSSLDSQVCRISL